MMELAKLCRIKRRFADAVRFYADAFAAEPKWADDLQSGYRYYAARLAVWVAAGQGEGAAKLDDKERVRLRKQALDWLRTDLTLWRKQIEVGAPQERAAAQKTLRHWQQDAYLVGLRDIAALDELPEAERAACRKLWDDVADLLKK
jgi:serine/threonine-protein kinase